jgi:hypothetical protein
MPGNDSAPIAARSLVRRTAVAAIVASVADLAVFAAAHGFWGVPGGFGMLNPGSIVVVALAATVIAGAGRAVFRKFTRRARAVFLVALVVATGLSLAGPMQAMAGAIPGMPRASFATGVTMVVLHLVTASVIAGFLG